MSHPIISATALQTLMQRASKLCIIDSTHYLDDPPRGRREFEDSHIAGALYADLGTDLSAQDGEPALNGGRHPLPPRERFAETLGHWGITPDTHVVVYDRVGTLTAGRVWWMLRWCGHAAVQVLDGGWAAWQAIQGASASGPAAAATPAPAYPLAPALHEWLSAETVLAELGRDSQTLVDARAAPRFRGDVEALDPVAGHIPGALNRPFTENFQADGRFKPADQLREEWLALLGPRDSNSVVAYCGSGVSAVPNLIGLSLAGLPARGLYAGSWSEWSRAGHPSAQGG
jgi:thiosulfate/3-mercaptopyruvate sulfurtransferase